MPLYKYLIIREIGLGKEFRELTKYSIKISMKKFEFVNQALKQAEK